MTVLANVTEAITLVTGTVLPSMVTVIQEPPFIYGVGIAIVIATVGIAKWLMRIK